MLISILRAARNARAPQATMPTRRRRGSTSALDINGPIPADPTPFPRRAPINRTSEDLPWLAHPRAGRTSRPVGKSGGPSELSGLPREIDPFEADWPWPTRAAGSEEVAAGSTERSRTFDEDLQRVLAMFAA
jgi:hypothetical protein